MALPDVLGASVVWGLLECRLVPDEVRVDVAVMLAAGTSRDALSAALLHRPEIWPRDWDAAGRAIVAWILPGHPIHEARHLSLEWDSTPAVQPPFPFVTFEHAPGVASSHQRALRIAEGLAEAVEGRRLGEIDRALVALAPAEASLLHFGCMGKRANGAHRWVVGLPASAVHGYLAALAIGRSAVDIAGWATRLGESAPHVSLHFDVGEDLRETVGLELFFPGPPRVDRRWRPLLDTLMELRLASPVALEALLDWPGSAGGLTRLLDVKLILLRGRPVQAKAYLAFTRTDGASLVSPLKPGA